MASEIPKSLQEWLKKDDEVEAKIKKMMPKALAIQKKKFLIAINKLVEQEISAEEEELVKVVLDKNSRGLTFLLHSNISNIWDDTKLNKKVTDSLKEHAHFDMNKYLNCAKIIFLVYSGIVIHSIQAAEYVIRHARQFGDTSKCIFQTREDSTNSSKKIDWDPKPLPTSKFMNKIEQLIEDLRSRYDEGKFKILNVNATYLALLIVRRMVKNENEFTAAFQRIHTHDSYVKLCPWPLDNQLPKPNTSSLFRSTIQGCAYLAIHAYLNTEDEITKRVLRVTCVQYMEWNGLQLPNLFFKVVDLYQIEASILWDRLCTNKTKNSLLFFAKEYYEQYRLLKEDPTKTQRWFPYCRLFDSGNFHRKLSASENKIICTILAYLVDLKIGLDKSTIRLSHWAKSNVIWSKECQKYAEKIYKEMSE